MVNIEGPDPATPSVEANMLDFLKNIPTRWLIIFMQIGLLSVIVLVAYSVMFQNKPVELWGIKVGESTEALHKQLQKAQAEIESRVPSEKYNAVLAPLREAESKISQQSSDIDNLKKQLKQREDKPSQLMKDLEETKAALGIARKELQLSKEENQKLIAQVNEMKKKDEPSFIFKKKIEAFSQQLSEIQKQGPNLNSYDQWAVVTSYNNILKSLKKDIPNDSYIQNTVELNTGGDWSYLRAAVTSGSSQLKNYLERTYLK